MKHRLCISIGYTIVMVISKYLKNCRFTESEKKLHLALETIFKWYASYKCQSFKLIIEILT